MKEEEISDEDVPDVVSTFYEGKTEVFDIKEKAKKMNKKGGNQRNSRCSIC